MQYGWFIDTLIYGDFTLNGMRITNSLNMLRQFKNKIPFGIACVSSEDIEPMFKESFRSGDSRLLILTESEVEEVEDYLRG